ncbi:leucine-rich repeat-containing G-protein coupled receptor 6-like isoform X1 [Harmonia axyridis]|uniref:leucine-rich repeat-containing G-protein coupled receptor 6-like isoform X1 n=2 Tax=Harmonia axyridis TaxID=115357 RepID=UPI001E27595F|nr:leucine-rich repeat-containing G-protein coupled receptor 6-like isoform X1 [Harmonia axyridis]
MDFYHVNLVILVLSCQRISASPNENSINLAAEKTNAEEISWSGKQLNDIPKGNTTIKRLDLAYNNILLLNSNIFQNRSYRDLTILDMHENRLNYISPLAFKGMKKLESIDLSFNNLKDIDTYTFEQSRKLEKIDFTSNSIKLTKSKVFLVSPSLKTLVLAKNDIDQLYELSFVGLKHLTHLILDENILNKIHPSCFKPLIDIQFLSLSNTGVMHLGVSMFTQIPRVINIEATPLANRFIPPLTRIKKDQVTNLLRAEDFERQNI